MSFTKGLSISIFIIMSDYLRYAVNKLQAVKDSLPICADRGIIAGTIFTMVCADTDDEGIKRILDEAMELESCKAFYKAI